MPLPIPRQATADCFFCASYGETEADLAWYDRPLLKEDGVGVAIPGVGAFVPGYVLVSPARHESSVRDLPANLATGFIDLVQAVTERVESAFGPATIFEHGSCRDEERRRSACITHSHVHILPGSYSFDSLGLPVKVFGDLSEVMKEKKPERADGYLMYREPGGPVCYAPDAGVSQYFRRHIARVLGRPDEWDYAVFPRWLNVRATRDMLTAGPLPAAGATKP